MKLSSSKRDHIGRNGPYDCSDPLGGVVNLTGQVQVKSGKVAAVGGFAKVWQGSWTNSSDNQGSAGVHELLAIKVLDTDRGYHKSSCGQQLTSFLHEIELWAGMNHPNVVPLYGVAFDIRPSNLASNIRPIPAMISPWRPNGNLNDFLRKNNGCLSLWDRDRMVQEVFDGLAYLHEDAFIVHGDLSGANILVDGEGKCCLADFGLSSRLDQSEESLNASCQHGTARWAAPELYVPGNLRPSQRRSKAGDVYSLGIIMLQILSGEVPWSHLPKDVSVIIAQSRGDIPRRPGYMVIDDPDWDLLRQCWMQDPCRRPGIMYARRSWRRRLLFYQSGGRLAYGRPRKATILSDGTQALNIVCEDGGVLTLTHSSTTYVSPSTESRLWWHESL